MYNPIFESLEERVLLSASPIDDATPAIHVSLESNQSTAPTLTEINTDSFYDLQSAINDLADGGTIQFNSVNDLTITFDATLNINKDITIENIGEGKVTFDGQNTHRILNITAGTVNIDSVTFSNGFSSYGSAIEVTSNANLTVENSTFTNNISTNGGIIHLYAAHGDITIHNSTFADNTGGGSLNSEGITSDGRSTVNFTLTNNTIVAEEGKFALNFQGHSTGTITIENNILLGNIYYGGGDGNNEINVSNNVMTDFVFTGSEGNDFKRWVNLVPEFNTIIAENTTNLVSTQWNGSEFVYTDNGQSNTEFRESLELNELSDNGGNVQTITFKQSSRLSGSKIGATRTINTGVELGSTSENITLYLGEGNSEHAHPNIAVRDPSTGEIREVIFSTSPINGNYGTLTYDYAAGADGDYIYTLNNDHPYQNGGNIREVFKLYEISSNNYINYTLNITVEPGNLLQSGEILINQDQPNTHGGNFLTNSSFNFSPITEWNISNREGTYGRIDSIGSYWNYTFNNDTDISSNNPVEERFDIIIKNQFGDTETQTLILTLTANPETADITESVSIPENETQLRFN